MSIQKRVQFVFLHFKKIGILATFSYFLQRIIKAKNHLIALRLKGLSHTIYLRNKTYDVHIFYQIFINEDLFLNYEEDISMILDCGANIGLATLYYQKKFHNPRIIAIEPENENYNLLVKNTQKYLNIHVLKNGVFDADCDLNVVDIGEGEASYRLMRIPIGGKIIQKILCRSINSLMKEFKLNKIDILKMDIEGCEKECLLSPNIEWFNETKYFLLEIHESIHPGLTKQIFDLIPISSTTSKNGEYTVIKNKLPDIL
jgi:FkbM family methyltransferase